MPQRIQLHRTKGWRKPEGAVVVARPTKWGNPFIVGKGEWPWAYDPDAFCPDIPADQRRLLAVKEAVDAYRLMLEGDGLLVGGLHHRLPVTPGMVRVELRGHDLACWCPLDQLCHAGVLLEMANASDDLRGEG